VNGSSRKLCSTRVSGFLFPKFGETLIGYLQRKDQVQVIKIGDFRKVTYYISETVQDTHRPIVSIKVEKEDFVAYAIYQWHFLILIAADIKLTARRFAGNDMLVRDVRTAPRQQVYWVLTSNWIRPALAAMQCPAQLLAGGLAISM